MTVLLLKRRTKKIIDQLNIDNDILREENARIRRVNEAQRNDFYKELTLIRNFVNFSIIYISPS